MSDIFDEDVANEDILLAHREWNQLNKFLDKDGYRDGVSEGREKSLQQSFNSGYSVSFEPFMTIATLEGIVAVLAYRSEKESQSDRLRTQLDTIKAYFNELISLTNSELSNTDRQQINKFTLSDTAISLFNTIKYETISICNHFKLDSIIDVIKDLSFTQ